MSFSFMHKDILKKFNNEYNSLCWVLKSEGFPLQKYIAFSISFSQSTRSKNPLSLMTAGSSLFSSFFSVSASDVPLPKCPEQNPNSWVIDSGLCWEWLSKSFLALAFRARLLSLKFLGEDIDIDVNNYLITSSYLIAFVCEKAFTSLGGNTPYDNERSWQNDRWWNTR